MVVVDRPGASQAELQVGLRWPALSVGEDAAARALVWLLEHRLGRQLRERLGLDRVEAWHQVSGREIRTFVGSIEDVTATVRLRSEARHALLPVIVVSAMTLNDQPAYGRFLMAHECSHHTLGHVAIYRRELGHLGPQPFFYIAPDVGESFNIMAFVVVVLGGMGSIRGVIVGATVAWLRNLGARPFVFPAMGSHGGGTPAGQVEVLASYGVTEEYCGCPIKASMETVVICQTAEGFPVHFDRHAYEADHVVVCGRVKPHTDFRGPIESGLAKIAAIGLGKQRGAGRKRFRAICSHSQSSLWASRASWRTSSLITR